MTAPAALRRCAKAVASSFDFREREGIVAWAERELYLPKRLSPEPGPLRFDRRPYMRGVLEALEDGSCKYVVLAWGSQSGKTSITAIWMGYRIANDPAPALIVMPNEKLARSYATGRLRPLFDSSPAIRAKYPDDLRKLGAIEMFFADMSLALVGSNSDANLASRPIELLVCDETDKYPESSDREAGALHLALNRTKEWPRARHIITSTPTVPTGDVWEWFMRGTQEKFCFPCPGCGVAHDIDFEKHVRWYERENKDDEWDLAKVAATAHWLCPDCGHKMRNDEKGEALRSGAWQGTANGEPGIRSFHLTSAYSPNVTLGQMAVKFLSDKNSLSGLKDFRNGWLALPWVDKATELGGGDLDKRKSDYELRTLPEGVAAVWIVIGIDVAQMFSNYVVRAFAESGESWLLDYGRFASPEDVAHYAQGARYDVCGEQMGINIGIMDSGYMTERVYQTCVDSSAAGLTIYPSKGGQEKFLRHPVRRADFTLGAKSFPNSLVHYGDNEMKRILYIESIKAGKGPWWIPRNVGRDYLEEMTREKLVEHRTPKGYDEPFWKRTGANHYADAEKLCLVFWLAR